MRKIGSALIALAAVLLSTACSSSASRDAAISRRIKTRIDVDPIVATDTVLVSTRDGVVTLEGSVSNRDALLRCLEIASMDPEVSRVVDRLQMSRPSRESDRRPVGVQAARASREDGEKKPASLEEPSHGAASAPAPAVIPAGEDEIALRSSDPVPPARAPASRMPGAVEAAAAAPEEVSVDDESLPGPATSSWQDVAASAEDAAITVRVRARIEESVPGGRILILTRRGFVTLSGIVNSDEDRRRAVRSARETEGVAGVEDRIVVVWS
jgi:osmotically-inducible protein OsmY